MARRKFYLFLAAMLAFTTVARALTTPVFSTEENPAWYYVQFNNGNWTVADQGSGSLLKTASKASTDGQKWQLIGTKDNFVMKSQSGNYVAWNGSAYTTASSGVALKLVKSSTTDCWEIARVAGSLTWNMHQGAGSGKEIHEYTVGDIGNPLQFVQASAILPTFSDATNETWYFVQFKNGMGAFSDMGTGELVRTASPEPVDGQLWKLVGTKENFQLVNKLGHYAVVSDVAATAAEMKNGGACSTPIRVAETAYAAGFSLTETGSTTYALGWEISPNDLTGKSLNQWGGGGIDFAIGIWNTNDNNNPVAFVNPDDMEYADYTVEGIASFVPAHPLTLWYDQPTTTTDAANKWMEYSLPIGNGQLGACLHGGVYKDEIQFNEKTLWTGGPNDMGSYGQYKNFGSVFVQNLSEGFSFGTTAPAKNYVRFLDIEEGVAGVNYTNADGSASYARRYLSSYPDQVIAAHYTAGGTGKLHLLFSVVPGEGINASEVDYTDSDATFSGKLTTVSYAARFRVVPVGDGATVQATEEGIVVENADEVLLLLAGATDYDASKTSFVSGENPADGVMARIDAAAQKGWDAIYADHTADFSGYMGRVSFQLDNAASNLPTNQLIDNYNTASKNVTGTEPEVLFLEQLYFAYGRYLMISSSRGVDVPSNLQGIWNDKSAAPWNSDIHSNINVQMNYWPAEPTNLSEFHLPFLNYIINMANGANWQKVATRAGQTKGWSCYTENNIFGGMSTWGSNYLIANAWYCSHLWQHYRYTLDKEFLKRAFPVMWSATEFWMERMIKDKTVNDGTYVCPNEYSPEQDSHPSEDGTAHSQQLVYALLNSVKASVDILGQEACGLTFDQLSQLDDYLANTDRGLATEEYTGKWGAVDGVESGDILLREWKYAAYSVSNDRTHRHLSHLMCLYPLNQVTPSSPYFGPAVTSLRLRGDEATGWSMGWKVNLWARALDGDHAHIILHNALKHSTAYTTNQYAGGIYYNLFDSHSPFQIDGNFGVCAGVAEMLLQSHTDTLQILPALPGVWQNGQVSGLKAVGDFTVDITWQEGRPVTATIVSNQGQPLMLSYPGIAGRKIMVNGEEVAVKAENADAVSLPTKAGDRIEVLFSQASTGIGRPQENVADGMTVTGRTVAFTNPGIVGIRVCDLAGRSLLQTSDNRFEAAPDWGNVFVVTATYSSGNTTSRKVVLP